MKRFLLIIAATASLSACQTPFVIGPQAPAPLAGTTVDDVALRDIWKSFDLALDAINLYMDAKPSVIGTPGAVRLANAIDAVTLALTAAEKAAAAGSNTDYVEAIAQARAAFADMKAAITVLKGQ